MTVKELLDKFQLTQQQLADFTGIPRDRIAKWVTKNISPPKEADANIIRLSCEFFTSIEFHEIQSAVTNYRVMGMNIEPTKQFLSSAKQLSEKKENEIFKKLPEKRSKLAINELNHIPFYDVDLIAGISTLYDDNPNYQPLYYMDVPQFSGCTAFPVYADSMAPLIEPGSVIFCKKIENWHMVLEYGQIYAVQLNDMRRFIKRIRKSPEQDTFLMRSENTAEYDDFIVPKHEISNVWLVEGWMRKKTQ